LLKVNVKKPDTQNARESPIYKKPVNVDYYEEKAISI
jgi:hypothetical protein